MAITHWLGCLPTFLMREAALGTLANFVALYGMGWRTLRGTSYRSPKRSRTPHGAHGPRILWGVLARGCYVSPLWRVQYQRLLWHASYVRTPGTTKAVVQAVL